MIRLIAVGVALSLATSAQAVLLDQGPTGRDRLQGPDRSDERLDSIVADHIEHRLVQVKRLDEILSSVLDRREERAQKLVSGGLGCVNGRMSLKLGRARYNRPQSPSIC